MDARLVHVDLIVRQDAAPLERLGKPLGLPPLAEERHADDLRTRADVDADL
jgi:hypothetical protein